MTFKAIETMETPTLLLRPLEAGDAAALFQQMLGDAETVRDLTFERHATALTTHEYITQALVGWKYGSMFRYVLVCKDTGALTAIIELTPRLPQVELGLVISRKGGTRRRRHGIIAFRAFLDWLIGQPGVYRVFACCAVDGLAHSSMERLGFKQEGRLVNYEARPNRGLVAADSYLYALTRPVTLATPVKSLHAEKNTVGAEPSMTSAVAVEEY
jgi:[ribosomal protein S5]-alanine N-acetyltransferase